MLGEILLISSIIREARKFWKERVRAGFGTASNPPNPLSLVFSEGRGGGMDGSAERPSARTLHCIILRSLLFGLLPDNGAFDHFRGKSVELLLVFESESELERVWVSNVGVGGGKWYVGVGFMEWNMILFCASKLGLL